MTPEGVDAKPKKVQREFPWCTVCLVGSALLCHTLVLMGNVMTAQSFGAIGKSTNGWANVGLNLATTLTTEMDVLMTTMTEKLTAVVDQVLEAKEQIDNAFYLIGNVTDVLANLSDESLLELRSNGHDPSALIADKSALTKVITHHIIDNKMMLDAPENHKYLNHADAVRRMESSLDSHKAHLKMIQLTSSAHMRQPSHGSCVTVKGDPCIFPFKYNGTVQERCSYQDSDDGSSWCATEVDGNGAYAGRWGRCADVCIEERRMKQTTPFSFIQMHSFDVQAKAEAAVDEPAWQCHKYVAGQDDEWCGKTQYEEGFEYHFNGGKSLDQCDGCWCCKREARQRKLPQPKVPATQASVDSEASITSEWQCHDYIGAQDDDWCSMTQFHGGFEFSFNGGEYDQCNGCWCCKREVHRYEESLLKDEDKKKEYLKNEDKKKEDKKNKDKKASGDDDKKDDKKDDDKKSDKKDDDKKATSESSTEAKSVAVSSGGCQTTDGVPCAFPFTWAGGVYNGCTDKRHFTWWCSTEVDDNGNFISGKWGNCDSKCEDLGKYDKSPFQVPRNNFTEVGPGCCSGDRDEKAGRIYAGEQDSLLECQAKCQSMKDCGLVEYGYKKGDDKDKKSCFIWSSKQNCTKLATGSKDCDGKSGADGVVVYRFTPMADAPLTATAGLNITNSSNFICPKPTTGCKKGHDKYQNVDCDGDGIKDHICQSTMSRKQLYLVLSTEGCPDDWGKRDRLTSECPYQTLEEAHAGAWQDLGAGCCAGGRENEQGRIFAAQLDSVKECEDKCAQWDMCGVIEYGWGAPDPKWCFIWSKIQNCTKLATGSTDCGGRGGDNGVRSYKFAPTTTTTTRLGACGRPREGCREEYQVYRMVDCDEDGIWDHMCTSVIDDKMSLVLSKENCPKDWGRDDRKKEECPGAATVKPPEGAWEDMGAGCCEGMRDNRHGRAWADKANTKEVCQARCATYADCAFIEYGWGTAGQDDFCFIWNTKQKCKALNDTASGCGGRGGDNGVHVYKYTPPPPSAMKKPEAACPRPAIGCTSPNDEYTKVDCDGDGILDHMCRDKEGGELYLILSTNGCPRDWGSGDRKPAECPELSLAVAASGDWADLGEGCCAGERHNEQGRMFAARLPTLEACEARCAGWEACGYIEYGWGKGDTEWCFIWDKGLQKCSSLAKGPTDCGGRGGDNGVHTYKFTPIKNGSAIAGCARPMDGCREPQQMYKTVDCDADGVLDHVCLDVTNEDRWLVLSSEGCPTKWDFTKLREKKECPESLWATSSDDWTQQGTGCCSGERENEQGRMFAGEMPTLDYCMSKCATWKDCGWVEYGYGGVHSKWCFIWSEKQECKTRATGPKDCGGRGGDNGVTVYKYTPQPSFQTAIAAACPRPLEGCTGEDEVYAKVDCDGDKVFDHMCTTSTTDSKMYLVLSGEKCGDGTWGPSTRRPSDCPELQLTSAKAGDWVDLGEGCCTGERHNEQGRMFADRMPTVEHCQSRCASWEDCGFIEYGWGLGDVEWCFVWNKNLQRCAALDRGEKDCGGRGGNNGVRVYKFVPGTTTTTTTSAPATTMSALTAGNCKDDEKWCDLGAGCCSDPRNDMYGRMHASEQPDLETCKKKCESWSNCGVVEYGWGGDSSKWCFIWSNIQKCTTLNPNTEACGGRGGNNGVHAYRFNPLAGGATTPAPTPCPEMAVRAKPCTVDQSWCDLGAGCCAGNLRDESEGKIAELSAASLDECKGICEKTRNCAFVEYGWGNETEKTTCFLWNYNQRCTGLQDKKGQCSGKGGDNGVHAYQYNRFLTTVTTTTVTTTSGERMMPMAEACSADIGDGAFMACVFPFTYKGVKNEKCSLQDHWTFWCATKVDEAGDAIPGYKGDCSYACQPLGFVEPPPLAPKPGRWSDLGAGCCSAKRDLENGRMFAGPMPSLQVCKDYCATLPDCGAVEYGYGIGQKDWCFIWSKWQKCETLVTGEKDCNERGGNNGVHVHRYTSVETTTTTTTAMDDMCRTTDGKLCIFPFMVEGSINTKCSIQNHYTYWCATQVDQGKNYIKGYWGECNANCKKWGYMEPSLMEPKAGDWTTVGDGCCNAERNDENGRLFSGPMPTLKACQDRCASWDNCAYIEYGWTSEGNTDWCFIWSTKQPCEERATGADDCNDKGGNNGVKVYQFDPATTMTTTETQPTTSTLAVPPVTPITTKLTSTTPEPTTTLTVPEFMSKYCEMDVVWCDMGEGCCKAKRDPESGLLWQGVVDDLGKCKDKCAEWRNCGVVEYGWDKNKSKWCTIWSNLQSCVALNQGKTSCDGRGGDNGVHSYRFDLESFMKLTTTTTTTTVTTTTVTTKKGDTTVTTTTTTTVGPVPASACYPPEKWCDMGEGCCSEARNPGFAFLNITQEDDLDACKKTCEENYKSCDVIEYGWKDKKLAKQCVIRGGQEFPTFSSRSCQNLTTTAMGKDVCEKDGAEGVHAYRLTRDVAELAATPAPAAAAPPTCPRPTVGCLVYPEVYTTLDCDRDGILDHMCTIAGNSSMRSLVLSTQGCPPVWGSSDRPASDCLCPRPSNGCAAPSEIYSNFDCDGDGLPDHACATESKELYLVLTREGCPQDWGYGNRSLSECTTLTTTTTTAGTFCCIGALDISLFEGRHLRVLNHSSQLAVKAEVDRVVQQTADGNWKGLLYAEINETVKKAMGTVNENIDKFFVMIHPALVQIGAWLQKFGQKIQSTIEGFGTTIDKVQKIIDSILASIAGSSGKAQVEYDTYTLFDMGGTGFITVDDLKLVGKTYGIQALDGDKVTTLFKKYDQNNDDKITEKEFSRMVEDDSIPGCMCVVLRSFSKKLAQIAGNVQAARLRDEVAKAVMEYLTHISAKNKTKVQWVSDRLTNASIPMAFTADVFKQLAMAVDNPDKPSNVDVGLLVVTEMVVLKPTYVSETLKLMSDPKFWESEGFDPTDQPKCVERVTAWVTKATSTVGDATALYHLLGPNQASFQEISELLPAMPMMARQTVHHRARKYRAQQRMLHAAKMRELKMPKSAKMLFDIILGGTPASAGNDDPTAKATLNSGVMAVPETLEFAKFLSWNASATAKRFQDQCQAYMGDSSSALDSFANQIQAMTKKMTNFLKMMMAYSTPTGIKRLEDQVKEFTKNAAQNIMNVIEQKLLAPMSTSKANGKGTVLLGVPRRAPDMAKMSEIFTVLNTVLTALQGALPPVIDDLKFARKEVSAVSSQLKNIFGMVKVKGPPIFDLVASLYQTLWVVYYVFFAALTLGLLFYGFWSSGYFGGPEATVGEYEPPVTMKERCVACWRSCNTCMANCHDTQLCFWSCVLFMEVIVLVLFVVAIILTLLSGVKAFINAGCSQVYLLGDPTICTGILGVVQTWLSKFWSGENVLNVCDTEYLMTCQLIYGKMKTSVIYTTVGSMLAAVLSFQMIIQSAILHEQARWRRIASSYEKDV